MNLRLLALVPALALLLSACAAGPAYRRPDVTLPAQWSSGAAAPQDAAPASTWWAGFQSPELDRLIAAALDANRDLKAAASRIAQARALARIAGADRLPTVGASASVSRDKRADARGSTSWGATLDAAFEVDLSGRNREAQGAAVARAQASVHAHDAVALALQAAVATTYFQLLSAQDRLSVAQTSLRNAESVLRLLQVQHRAGAISGLDVLRQQGLVASAKADMAPIEQQRRQSHDALAVLLGRHPQDLGLAATSLASIRLPAIDAGVPSALLARRPDIRQAEADLIAAHADIAAARAALFPSVQLSAAGTADSASIGSLLRPASLAYSLAAGLAAPIFDGGRRRSQVALSQARQDELLQAYQQAILRALREAEDGLAAVQHLAEQAANQADVVARATAAQAMAELRWRNGAVDFTTVLDAQRVLLAAQAAQQTVTLSRYAAAVGLYRALGGGGDSSP